jgi:CcmD family protein
MRRLLLMMALMMIATADAWHSVARHHIDRYSLAAQTPQPPAQEGFVPVDRLPDQEQLPAAPLVAAAYGVAWAAIFIYVWFLWRRLARVERDLADVARRMNSGGGR